VNTDQGNLGVTRFQTFIDSKGQRSSLAAAFFMPEVLARPNLHVACNVYVSRILFDKITTDELRAIGVEFQTARGANASRSTPDERLSTPQEPPTHRRLSC
jgi:choline dehydrogenase